MKDKKIKDKRQRDKRDIPGSILALPRQGHRVSRSRKKPFAPGIRQIDPRVHAVSVMEEADAGEDHGHAVAVTGFDDCIIPDGAAGFCHIEDAALMGPFDVV